jgi:hypothetical protein
MEEIKSQKGPARLITFGLLLFILIISPALSWYYLRSGVDYRKNSLSELKDYGKLDCTSWRLIGRSPITSDSLKGRIVIAQLVNPSGALGAKSTEVMNKLFDQFKDRRDVVLFTALTHCDSSSALAYAKQHNPKRYANYWFSTLSDAEIAPMLQSLKLAQKGDFSQQECPYFVYTNMEGTVSNFYDVNDNQQLGRLVEHIAMKLTIDKFETPKIQRDKEK